MTGAAPDVFPCPVFEGSEKRISVTFSAVAGASTPPPAAGLRTLTRAQLDEMLDLAACQIVSSRSNEHFDAYVLSESSLFVYPGERRGGGRQHGSRLPHGISAAWSHRRALRHGRGGSKGSIVLLRAGLGAACCWGDGSPGEAAAVQLPVARASSGRSHGADEFYVLGSPDV